jgi:hypothetical protein
MRKMAGLIAACGLLVPTLAWSADLGVNGTTIVRIEEQGSPGTGKSRIVPGTQFLGIDAAGLADGNLSLHFNGWGRHDFDETSAGAHKNDGELTYGYLRYRFPKANGELKAGRLFITEGVAFEQLDGLAARADLAGNLTLSVYGGAPVRFDNDNKGDYLGGGRLAFRVPGILEIGASSLYEKGAASRGFITGITPPDFIREDHRFLAGADIWLSPVSMVELSGHTDYNVATSAVAEHSYRLQVTPMKQLILAGTYNERLFKGYFAGTNLPNLFQPNALDSSRSYGGSVTLVVAKPLSITADYTHIHRDTVGGSDRYGAEARLSFTAAKVQAGASYHRLDAPDITTALVVLPSYDLSFHEVRGWVRYDPGRYFASVDAIGHFFDDRNNPNLNGKKTSYQVTASGGFRIADMVTVSGDVSYGENPQYTEEFKGLVRVNFAYAMTSKGGKK